MKTNNFDTGNMLRDIFLQSHLHGVEFRDLVCSRLGWSAYRFKQQTTGSRLFLPEDALAFVSIQVETIQNRFAYTEKYMGSIRRLLDEIGN